MNKPHLLGYAVVVSISVALACALTERSYLPRDLMIGLAFGLLAGFYEWQKAEIRKRHNHLICEMGNAIRNRLQVIRCFSFIPPSDRENIIAGQVEGIRAELTIVGQSDNRGLDDLGRSAAGASPMRKHSQGTRSKTQRAGIA